MKSDFTVHIRLNILTELPSSQFSSIRESGPYVYKCFLFSVTCTLFCYFLLCVCCVLYVHCEVNDKIALFLYVVFCILYLSSVIGGWRMTDWLMTDEQEGVNLWQLVTVPLAESLSYVQSPFYWSWKLLPNQKSIMAKNKIKTLVIKMVSTAGTGFFYVTSKNPRTTVRKLSLRKVRSTNRNSLCCTFRYFFEPYCSFREQLTLTPICCLIFYQYDPIVRQHVIFSESKMK